MPATKQIAIIQSKSSNGDELPLAISHSQPVPELPTPYHVLVRVSAVGLNPTDHKMVTHFYMEGRTVGCDFCGVIESAGPSSLLPVGTRVCGADFPYRKNNAYNGAFSERVSADSRQMLVVPDDWSDVQGAALGAIGWGTVCMSLSDPEALGLAGLPSKPLVSEKPIYVLVYGAGTATGVLTIQILK
jgi:NADPH:quinone reductase-like Zn-dependent oxidoreductase